MSVNLHPQLLTVGITFRDLVISGVDRLPGLGEERHGTDFVPTWGGVANTARIAASLGARVRLLTGLGDDSNSALCRRELTDWGIDLGPSPVTAGWALPVTMSQACGTERAMTTVETPLPVPFPTPDLTGTDVVVTHVPVPAPSWLHEAAAAGIPVIADHGFEERPEPGLLEVVSGCTCYTPNAAEAMQLTGTDDPVHAARALAEHVPVVIVTCGGEGIVGADSRTGEQVQVPAVPITPVNTTGAGDATLAGLAWTWGWDVPLVRKLTVAALVGAIVTSRAHGTADPLTVADLFSWVLRDPGRLGFLTDLLG
ncbi:MAG: carbohydrate kinase family protein [Cutibacterium granulosum]|uniref:carbohydrate kinase family protein n=1 Tax=Cutibacterium granulosum TaxID=33011 RepID=UPI002B2248BE|nr:carbohydrate kinase family protein [Cutibacterium granulosum]MEA5648804.1 carbohydrate kinase family protein [Cutibacterium granulosum]MEA5653705.1 carbohydrate kinase family protein [Cutibacterium granulosum]MEA5663414.1 carbohydrate kinase family protein [Cutibacterium granulosum]MEA5664403.1 carbohydrate kinase family protein [Cutibacterium granulosum]